MTQAAILIQSKFRSYYEQKKFQQSRRAAVLIQQYYRSYKEYEKLKPGHRASAAMQQKIKWVSGPWGGGGDGLSASTPGPAPPAPGPTGKVPTCLALSAHGCLFHSSPQLAPCLDPGDVISLRWEGGDNFSPVMCPPPPVWMP